jgi:DNA-directed RNA polymerase subunit RPC12/RpoP
MTDKVYVCSKCGAEDSISELVTVEVAVEGWRGVKVEAGADAAPEATPENENRGLDRDAADLRDADWHTAGCYAYHCAECERQSPTLAEAVVVKPRVECRDCGFDGEPEDHPAGCGGELLGLDAPEPLPGQITLEVAA